MELWKCQTIGLNPDANYVNVIHEYFFFLIL